MTSQDNPHHPHLTDEQKRVMFDGGTEMPGTGKYLNHNQDGQYVCANCGKVVFKSDAKYDSKTPGLIGWPSFSEAADRNAIKLSDDNTLGMKRTEVTCANCGGHLGHLFPADDAPTGQHYCINSCALDFAKTDKSS